MNITIHRGSKEIGGSCVEIAHDGKRILIDMGLPLDADGNDRRYLPNIPGLDGSDPSLLGIMISHPHLDHFGLLAHVSPNIPTGMGAAARRILAAAAPFLPGEWPLPSPGWDFQSAQAFDVGPFRITPYLVDHSAYDSYALLVEAGGKRVFYSGDFRAHGRKAALFDSMVANPPKDIDVLLVEGSSIGRLDDNERFPTERDIEAELVKLFSLTEGMALVQTSIQNIDRIVSIFRASKKTGRRLVMDLYAAVVLEATGKESIPKSEWSEVALYIPQKQRVQIKDNAWFDLLKRHSKNRIYIQHLKEAPQKSTLLFRQWHCEDLAKGGLLKGAAYIYSQWEGYWENGSYDKVQKWLDRHGIPKTSIHTSGHASLADLKTFVAALSPQKVVPIHSFRPDRYPELFPNVEAHDDGEWWDV